MSAKSNDKWSKVAEQADKADELTAERDEFMEADNESDAELGGEQKALEHPDYDELEQQLGEAELKINDYWNKILRMQAEIDNLHRRSERDLANAHKFGIEKLLLELLPVIDSVDKGLEIEVADNELAQQLREGMELTLSMFSKALAKFGVEVVNPIAERFNPEFHEAISMIEQADAESNTVVKVLQKGYVLNSRLVRPALVIVAK